MVRLQQFIDFLREFAPPELAEKWDNVGLLVGDPESAVSSVMTCLTLTPNVAEEAIRDRVQVIVSHHPVLFRPVQRLTAETHEGRMLLALIQAGIAVYSPHTRYDSAADGINAQLARQFNLSDVRPIRPVPAISNSAERSDADGTRSSLGSGRWGRLRTPMPLSDLIQLTKGVLKQTHLQYVGGLDRTITRLGIACGSAAEFLRDAVQLGCEALLTGEARFHACLEAEALGIALLLPGHYATERPAMESLAQILRGQFPELTVKASSSESDPLKFA